MNAPLLEVRKLTKSFPGVRALRGVSLSLGHGEVLAVIGENGAGKSTLMKILAGVQAQDTGELLVDGKTRSLRSVHDAMQLGIALIHQELNLAETLEVGANIYLGREPRKFGFIDFKQISADSRQILAKVGLDISPETPLSELTIGQQQLVEIAKALSINARVLIMDEPTSSLTVHETEALLGLIRDLRSRGVSVVYISHRLGEVEAVADRVAVLRDGENAGALYGSEIKRSNMVRLMVGRELSQFYPHECHATDSVAFELRGLRSPANPRHEVSFKVHAGEVVSLAGLVGAGRTELLESVFGIAPALAGDLMVEGTSISPRNPAEAISAGIALVPEDRKHHGLVLEMGAQANLSLPSIFRDQSLGFLNREKEASIYEEMREAMRIKTPNGEQPVQFLSGGNQQKVVIGKWLAMHPRVLLLDEPTRGVDIGAKQEIYRLMDELAAKGVAIVFASSDMQEILGMSDRVLVMHEGRLSGEISRSELSEQAIMALATGSALSECVTE